MKAVHPLMDEGGNEAPSFKNYSVEFKAVIKGTAIISAPSKVKAMDTFKASGGREFDTLDEIINFKVVNVKEI